MIKEFFMVETLFLPKQNNEGRIKTIDYFYLELFDFTALFIDGLKIQSNQLFTLNINKVK
jgi:hypothetical protein